MCMMVSYALLGLLHEGPSYGYDLKKAYDKLFGAQKPLRFGQIYATLGRLLRDERVTVEEGGKSGGPERKRYQLTPLGKQELTKWLGTPEDVLPAAQAGLFVKVATAILADVSPNDYLDVQRASHLAKMRELTRLRREGDLAQALRADYMLFHLEADLRWIDVTASRIKELTEDIRDER